MLPHKTLTGLTMVRLDPDHPFNDGSRVVFLEDCESYNVALLPMMPGDDDCKLFAVVDREGREK